MPHTPLLTLARPIAVALAIATGALAVGGCIPIIMGGAVMGTFAATDRRTMGNQVEDQSIELKSSNRISGRYGDKGHVVINAYNRKVLLTGEVPNDAAKADAELQASTIENVRSVINELQVGPPSSLTTRSNDTLITGKVKASLIDAKDLFANAFLINTQRGTVYLMGRVTEREGKRAASIAAGVSGVTKVVKVFDYITEAELADLSKVKAEQDEAAKNAPGAK
ncbi:BON domain-containing protein [Pigmentiphaga litoralis]|uniref:Osmotically-inducible protein OsmY n=1 Tax=Pigmentiphaga litoralis TaxID=516702 RepID=A0A7Y9LJI6_9BURK|nr:BON domain-containing protein [Pigmentiphaga litoralis]NYE24382.1 osmotically-inducible protein OsmY [Pigmentiphaga litoralis]NYE82004.1 osmotically-inducible protein OsmY [Pigmentiphaga litoralis]